MRFKSILACFALPLCFFGCGGGENAGPAAENSASTAPKNETSTAVVEVVDGVRHVHNTGPKWRGGKGLRLDFVRKFGEFFKPFDLCLDSEGNIYITESGNSRVLKYSPEGALLTSFGRHGQGPGEFQIMGGVAVDDEGRLYITDRTTNRLKVLSPEGEELANLSLGNITGGIERLPSGEFLVSKALSYDAGSIPGLVRVMDGTGATVRSMGRQELRDDYDEYRYFNRTAFAVDRQGRVYLAFSTRNKIERYDPEGNLELVIDRPLNFEISKSVLQVKRRIGPREMEIPQANFVSKSLEVDDHGRIWVLSYDRQLTFEEQPLIMHIFGEGPGLEATKTLKTSDDAKTDAFVIHVFDLSGVFLGKIPLAHFADRIRIFRDRLYILELSNEMCLYEYRIIEP
ncbi:MAG: NHL repeat-containing protein [Candidatus Aminicenantes bacterium]|nr:NHL repeat-containing protein [Candidatus Aminicenantes bacterium]